jgi:hypothetical protein
MPDRQDLIDQQLDAIARRFGQEWHRITGAPDAIRKAARAVVYAPTGAATAKALGLLVATATVSTLEHSWATAAGIEWRDRFRRGYVEDGRRGDPLAGKSLPTYRTDATMVVAVRDASGTIIGYQHRPMREVLRAQD